MLRRAPYGDQGSGGAVVPPVDGLAEVVTASRVWERLAEAVEELPPVEFAKWKEGGAAETADERMAYCYALALLGNAKGNHHPQSLIANAVRARGVLKGWAKKKAGGSNLTGRWKDRWFCQVGADLSYYEDENIMCVSSQKTKPKGRMRVTSATLNANKNGWTFSGTAYGDATGGQNEKNLTWKVKVSSEASKEKSTLDLKAAAAIGCCINCGMGVYFFAKWVLVL